MRGQPARRLCQDEQLGAAGVAHLLHRASREPHPRAADQEAQGALPARDLVRVRVRVRVRVSPNPNPNPDPDPDPDPNPNQARCRQAARSFWYDWRAKLESASSRSLSGAMAGLEKDLGACLQQAEELEQLRTRLASSVETAESRVGRIPTPTLTPAPTLTPTPTLTSTLALIVTLTPSPRRCPSAWPSRGGT